MPNGRAWHFNPEGNVLDLGKVSKSVCAFVWTCRNRLMWFYLFFILDCRNTGKPFHNFITWQDLRAAELARSWNRSCTMKVRLQCLLLSQIIIIWDGTCTVFSLWFTLLFWGVLHSILERKHDINKAKSLWEYQGLRKWHVFKEYICWDMKDCVFGFDFSTF